MEATTASQGIGSVPTGTGSASPNGSGRFAREEPPASAPHLAPPDSPAVRIIEVTDEEREHAARAIDNSDLHALAEDALEPGMPEFFDSAEILEGALPYDARRALTALRRSEAAVVVMRGLASDPDPGPTPTEQKPFAPLPLRAQAWLAMAVRRLGHEYAYAMEKKGAVIHNVHPTAEGAETQSNASFKINLSLHTENAFHPIRPDFVCLYCIRTPPEAPATRLVLLEDVLAQLTDQEIAILREPRFKLRVVDSHLAEGEDNIELPVVPLTGSMRKPILRWHETLRATDPIADRVAKAFDEAAARATRYVKLQEGDLLAFANDCCLHGRDAFPAKLDGTDRWLVRGYAIRDFTRTLPFVPPARPRVTRVDLAAHAAG
jgi:L-asparagine oxygenase